MTALGSLTCSDIWTRGWDFFSLSRLLIKYGHHGRDRTRILGFDNAHLSGCRERNLNLSLCAQHTECGTGRVYEVRVEVVRCGTVVRVEIPAPLIRSTVTILFCVVADQKKNVYPCMAPQYLRSNALKRIIFHLCRRPHLYCVPASIESLRPAVLLSPITLFHRIYASLKPKRPAFGLRALPLLSAGASAGNCASSGSLFSQEQEG